MNCVEAQEVLPEIIDGSPNTEFQTHLKSCPICSELVSDLQLIASEARHLADADQPADRVWVRIAAELRAEGLIREPEAVPARPVLVPNAGRSWNAWWLVPVAAALLAAGAYVIKPKPSPQVANSPVINTPQPAPQVAQEQPSVASQPAAGKNPPVVLPFPQEMANSDQNDQQFLDEMSRQVPMMRATYENQLRTVNSYIRDAEAYSRQNPWDEDAQRQVMDAHQQKSMLYQMALDHVQ
jgi:negative regulator of sigma E activity